MKKKTRAPREVVPRWDRRRLALVVFPLLLVIVLFALWKRPKPKKVVDQHEDTTVDEYEPRTDRFEHHEEPSNPFPMAVTSASAAPEVKRDPPPVIDDILWEKPEVCAGEENLVTVKSHTVNGTDSDLHTVIDGQLGHQVPITLWTDDDGKVLGTHTVTVFGRGNVSTTAPLPKVVVKECRPTYIASIQHRVRANTWADFEFQARVVGVPPAPTPADRQRGAPPPKVPVPFKPVAYTWDFGDGESTTTLVPLAEHDYEGREQNALYSYFVVSVTVTGAKGESVKGRMTLPLINPAYEALAQKGIVALMIALEPRFPQAAPDGSVTQQVRIWHTRPGPVTIDHAILTQFYTQGAGESQPHEVDVSSVLGSSVIPAGKDGVTVTVTIAADEQEHLFSKTWQLSGRSAEGYPATGSFSIMRPPPKPTAETAQEIHDPMLRQKVVLARQILGKDVVNDEDLWRLDREGMFANLQQPTPAEKAAAAQAAIAQAVRNGPPSQQGTVVPGAAVPTSTAEQRAQPAQGAGPLPPK